MSETQSEMANDIQRGKNRGWLGGKELTSETAARMTYLDIARDGVFLPTKDIKEGESLAGAFARCLTHDESGESIPYRPFLVVDRIPAIMKALPPDQSYEFLMRMQLEYPDVNLSKELAYSWRASIANEKE